MTDDSTFVVDTPNPTPTDVFHFNEGLLYEEICVVVLDNVVGPLRDCVSGPQELIMEPKKQ